MRLLASTDREDGHHPHTEKVGFGIDRLIQSLICKTELRMSEPFAMGPVQFS